MAHYQKALFAAAALNAASFIAEAVAGIWGQSFSLLMDGVHNATDEMALVFLYLAYILPQGVSRNLQRSANLVNSVGLVLVSAVLLWQAVERFLAPAPVVGLAAILVGAGSAAANWGVARVLRGPARDNASIRLACVHNLGDMYVSLAPIAAGLLVIATGRPVFDPLIAIGIGLWIMFSILRESLHSHEELIWPDKIVCGHEHETPADPALKEPA